MAERVRVREMDGDEGRRLQRIVPAKAQH